MSEKSLDNSQNEEVKEGENSKNENLNTSQSQIVAKEIK